VRPGRAADHSPPSNAAVMEEYSYTSTHSLGHTGPVTGSLYLYLYIYIYMLIITQTYFTGEITLHVAQIVNTEHLQHYIPQKHGLFQIYNSQYPP